MASADANIPNFPQPHEIRAWKSAHVMMWDRWQKVIDFEALKKRHL